MRTRGLAHENLHVGDFDRSKQFYTEVFGFELLSGGVKTIKGSVSRLNYGKPCFLHPARRSPGSQGGWQRSRRRSGAPAPRRQRG